MTHVQHLDHSLSIVYVVDDPVVPDPQTITCAVCHLAHARRSGFRSEIFERANEANVDLAIKSFEISSR
jgi:hypothetical protein